MEAPAEEADSDEPCGFAFSAKCIPDDGIGGPVLNQADVVGRLRFLGMRHTILMGYEFQNFATHTDRTPDGGDFFPGLGLPFFAEMTAQGLELVMKGGKEDAGSAGDTVGSILAGGGVSLGGERSLRGMRAAVTGLDVF